MSETRLLQSMVYCIVSLLADVKKLKNPKQTNQSFTLDAPVPSPQHTQKRWHGSNTWLTQHLNLGHVSGAF